MGDRFTLIRCSRGSAVAGVLTAVLFSGWAGPVKDEPLVSLSEWERGISVTSPYQEDMTVFVWFYEVEHVRGAEERPAHRGHL